MPKIGTARHRSQRYFAVSAVFDDEQKNADEITFPGVCEAHFRLPKPFVAVVFFSVLVTHEHTPTYFLFHFYLLFYFAQHHAGLSGDSFSRVTRSNEFLRDEKMANVDLILVK